MAELRKAGLWKNRGQGWTRIVMEVEISEADPLKSNAVEVAMSYSLEWFDSSNPEHVLSWMEQHPKPSWLRPIGLHRWKLMLSDVVRPEWHQP